MTNGECCVVVSYPRSGTHLTIDFLRRNFAPFADRLHPWESSERLYYNLDVRLPAEDGAPGFSRSRSGNPRKSLDYLEAARRPSFLVKTHELPFAPALPAKLEAAAGGRRITLLYPFRAFSRTVTSYHAHRQSTSTIEEFLAGPDPYLDWDQPIEEAIVAHGEWGLAHAVPLDIDRLIRAPSEAVAALSERFGWQTIAHRQPLPPKRLGGGRLGELVERLRGRPSSERLAKVPNRPLGEAAFVDRIDRLSQLHSQLCQRALNHAG